MILKAGQFTFQTESIACVRRCEPTVEIPHDETYTIVYVNGGDSFRLAGNDETEFLSRWNQLPTLEQAIADAQAAGRHLQEQAAQLQQAKAAYEQAMRGGSQRILLPH